MRMPSFLIIGAMRAGTTTLYADLKAHPEIYLPHWKEPEALCTDAVLSPAGRRRYAKLFGGARAGQRCGEASTAYTKRPTVEGVAQRAREVLGPELKLIYLVREPVARCRSQHHHEVGLGDTDAPLACAVREQPRFIDYSRYAMQLEPWLACFPQSQLLVVRFERYVAARDRTIRHICKFLDVDPEALPSIEDTQAFNRTSNRPSANRFWRTFVHGTMWYEAYVKPHVSYTTRRWLAGCLLPKAPLTPDALDPSTAAFIAKTLAEDTAEFEGLLRRHWPNDYQPSEAYDLRQYDAPAMDH